MDKNCHINDFDELRERYKTFGSSFCETKEVGMFDCKVQHIFWVNQKVKTSK